MTRRGMLFTAAGGAAGMAAAQQPPKNSFFELRQYFMRNSRTNQTRRTSDFVAKAYAPAAKRAGIGPVGIFSAVIAPQAPFLMVVSGYPSLAAMQTSLEKLAADADYQKAQAEYESGDLAYIRTESTLFRCFDSVPAVETGPAEPQRAARTFELRVYESDNNTTARRKMKMFNDGEVAIFRRNGLQPVFFGEAIVGPKLPRLTYMVAYDGGLSGREKVWQAFGADPEWQKLRSQPGLSDAEIVSNISNSILRPAAGSDIR